MDKYLTLWVKDNIGTEGHPLCRNGVADAKAKSAAEADKPKDMTPKDRQHTKHIQSAASEESEVDNDKKTHRKQPRKSKKDTQAIQY
ncbi:MAG: hypothetical protein ACKPKO_14640 [Candidatus Fonsibacter sp.]